MTQLNALSLLLLFITSSIACSSKSSEEKYRVMHKSDSDGKQLVVAIGEDAKLSCRTNVPWKKCFWKPPRNGVRELKCEFGRDKVTHWTCPSFPEVHFDREGSDSGACAIVVMHVEEHHEGNWRCEFELDVPEEAQAVFVKDKIKLIARGWRYP